MSGSRARFDPGFTLLHEAADHVVVNKPAPLQVHPKRPDGAPTLWHGLRELFAYELANGGQISIINRLDRETSGVTLVATSHDAARRFGIAMQERRFEKTYLAWVSGHPDWEEVTCGEPILRRAEVEDAPIWVEQIVHPEGAACTTHFRVLERGVAPWGALTLLEVRPETGRMHQIRVHLRHLGLPLIGDKLYGPDPQCYLEFIESGWSESLSARLHLPRQALHAWKLRLRGEGGQEWRAPVPDELTSLLPVDA